jgi:hypothetical protein
VLSIDKKGCPVLDNSNCELMDTFPTILHCALRSRTHNNVSAVVIMRFFMFDDYLMKRRVRRHVIDQVSVALNIDNLSKIF